VLISFLLNIEATPSNSQKAQNRKKGILIPDIILSALSITCVKMFVGNNIKLKFVCRKRIFYATLSQSKQPAKSYLPLAKGILPKSQVINPIAGLTNKKANTKYKTTP
jgi:hypothetical protein